MLGLDDANSLLYLVLICLLSLHVSGYLWTSRDVSSKRLTPKSASHEVARLPARTQETERAQALADTVGESHVFEGPRFPYLKITNELQNSSPKVIEPNAVKVQHIESEFVSGKVIFALRLRNDQGDVSDKYYPSFFEGRKRVFEIQMQMKLKTKPRGVIYLGGELPDQMKLGLVTKSLCKAIMGLINRLSGHAHASLAAKSSGMDFPESEQPHIVFPLFSAATKMIISKAGCDEKDIPDVENLQELAETKEQKKMRTKQGVNLPDDLDVGDTITFSLNSMYLDFVKWKVVNMGALQPMNLRQFWQQMPLSIVVYDLPTNPSQASIHINRNKLYYLNFRMENTTYKAKSGDDLFTFSQDKKPWSISDKFSTQESSESSSMSSSTTNSHNIIHQVSTDLPSSEGSSKPCTEWRCVSVLISSTPTQVKSGCVQSVYFVFVGRSQEKTSEYISCCVPLSELEKILNQTSLFFKNIITKEEHQFLRRIEKIRPTSKKMRKLEHIRLKLNFGLSNIALISKFQNETFTPRRFDLFEQAVVRAATLPDLIPKSSNAEWNDLGFSKFANYASKTIISDHLVFNTVWLVDAVVCIDSTTWVTARIALVEIQDKPTDGCTLVIYYPFSTKPSSLILLSDVLEMSSYSTAGKEGEVALNFMLPGVILKTLERNIVIGLKSASEVSDLVDQVNELKQHQANQNTLRMNTPKMIRKSSSMNFLRGSSFTMSKIPDTLTIAELVENLRLSLSSDFASNFSVMDNKYSSTRRRILNIKSEYFLSDNVNEIAYFESETFFHQFVNFVFSEFEQARKSGTPHRYVNFMERLITVNNELNHTFFEASFEPTDLNNLSEQIVEAARTVIKDPSRADTVLLFYNLVSRLKNIDILELVKLDESKRAAFFLNIYHSLLLHGRLLYTPPNSMLSWATFGLNSYNIGGVVFSLFDIEHQVLKKPFKRIKIGPKSVPFLQVPVNIGRNASMLTDRVALKLVDPRILFAINCGSKSCPEKLFVFKAGTPHEFSRCLNEAAEEYFTQETTVNESTSVIRLPKVCEWHGKDIGTEDTAYSILCGVKHLMPTTLQTRIDLLLKKSSSVKIKYRKFDWGASDRFL